MFNHSTRHQNNSRSKTQQTTLAADSRQRIKARIRRASIEVLEDRSLLTVIPQGLELAPTPVQNTPFTNQSVATFVSPTDSNPNDFSATILWGDGSITAGVIQPVGPVSTPGPGAFLFEILGDHTYSAQTNGQNLSVEVDINDKNDDTTSSAFSITKVADSSLTVAGTPVSITQTEGTVVTSNTALATFSHISANHTPGIYTAIVNWGDGSSSDLTQAVTVNPAGGPGAPDTITVASAGTHAYRNASTTPYSGSVTLIDDAGVRTSIPFTVTVTDAALAQNNLPTINSTVGAALTNVDIAVFTDGNPLAVASDFKATITWGSPSQTSPGTVVQDSNGAFHVLGSHTYDSSAPPTSPITVNVTDVTSSLTMNTTATVNAAQLVVSAVPETLIEGTTSIPAGTVVGSFIDLGGAQSAASYMVSGTVAQFPNAPSTPLTVTQVGSTNVYNLTTTAATTLNSPLEEGADTYTVSVDDSHGNAGMATGAFIIQDAPLSFISVNPSIAPVAGQPLNNLALMLFHDGNASSTPDDFKASIDWGDGTVPTIGSVTSTGGNYLVSGTHTYAKETSSPADYLITITVTDVGGKELTTSTAPFTVTDAPLTAGLGLPISGSKNVNLNDVTVATFTDGDPKGSPSDFTGSINWGDGSSSAAFFRTVGGGTAGAIIGVFGSHVYATTGSFNLTYTVNDSGGSTLANVAAGTAAIGQSSLTVTVLPITGSVGLAIPSGVIATVNIPGAIDPVTALTPIVINWGDGSSTTLTGGSVVASLGGGLYSISATGHTYSTPGTYVVTVSVTDTDPASGVGGAVAFISPPSLAVVTVSPISLSGVEGQAQSNITLTSFSSSNPDAVPSDFAASIDWGDGSVSQGTVTQLGGSGTPFTVTGSHTYKDEGDYVIEVSITDKTGGKTTTTATATIAEAGATAGSQISNSILQNSPLINANVASFTSNNPFDTAATFVATIDWGDGSPVTAGMILQDAGGQFHVSGTHTYTSTGTFFVSVVVSEADGATLLSINSSSKVTVTASPLLITPAVVHSVEGIALPNTQNVINGTIVATFADLGSSDPVTDYTATIDWGNGLTTAGTVVANGSNFAVLAPSSPNIIYAEAGNYTIKVTINDTENTIGGGIQGFVVSSAIVADAVLTATNPQPSVNAFQQTPLINVAVAQFNDANLNASLGDFTAIIDWGDGSPQSTGTLIQPGGLGTLISVTGNHTYANPTTPPASPYTITVYIKDVDGSRLTTTSQANVTATNITATPVTISGVESQPLASVVVAYFNDSGIAGPLSSYSAMINWGTGLSNANTFGQIVPLGGNNFEVLGTYTYEEENASTALPYSVTVTINHNGVAATAAVSQASIADAPLNGVAVPLYTTEGTSFKGTVGYFNDSDPNGTVSDYTAVINWGDGSSSSGTIQASGSGFIVLATDPISGLGHSYDEEGSYAYSITVTDKGGAAFTAYQTAAVADAALTATGLTLPGVGAPIFEFPAFNGIVANFTDADPLGQAPPVGASDYVATIYWGDGQSTTGTVTQLPTASGSPTQFTVSGSHFYEEGTYQVTVVIKDIGGLSTTTLSTITISDSPLTAGAPIAITATEGDAFQDTKVATFTDADLLGVMSDYTATIDWGDGTTSAGIIGQEANGTFDVSGSHTYKEEAATPYNISVSIKDAGGSTANVISTASVKDAPLAGSGAAIQGTEGLGLSQTGSNSYGSVIIGSFTDSDPLGTLADYTTAPGSIVVNWGDGSALQTLTAANLTLVGSPNGVVFTISALHTYLETGVYQVTTTVTDAGGAAAVLHGTATIADAPLSPAPSQPVVNVTEQVPFTLPIASFNDANPSAPIGDFKAIIDWGDNSPTSFASISQSNGSGTTFVVSGSHDYADSGADAPGVGQYMITVHVIDKDGATVTVINMANVSDPASNLTGYLNPSSDSGVSNSDNITNINTPNFLGTTEPLTQISLFAAPRSGGAWIALGSASANSTGAWSLTSSVAIPDGIYTVVATAKDQYGHVELTNPASPVVITQSLMIDTVGPVVNHVFFDRVHGQIDVSYSDNLSGVLTRTTQDASNYSFSKVHIAKQRGYLYLFNNAASSPGQNATSENVVLTLGQGRLMRGGFFNFLIHSLSTTPGSGIQDVAGNALDGEYYGYSPSGNRTNGGDFSVRLDAIHNVTYPPSTVFGAATPNVPAGTSQPSVYVPTINPSKVGNRIVPASTAATQIRKATVPNPVKQSSSIAARGLLSFEDDHLHEIARIHHTAMKGKRTH